MAAGRGGWKGVDVEPEDIDELTLVFFTFKKERPNGHTGTFILNGKTSKLDLLHASSFYGKTVLVPYEAKYRNKVTALRRITIGDKIERTKQSIPKTAKQPTGVLYRLFGINK